MAPGIDGLPAAERDVDVSGPVAEFLTSISPRLLARIKLGLRAFEWLPFPWRFSRLDPAAREDFLRRMERSRFQLHHELLLMAKIFTTLGYAVDPRVEERIGLETSCRLADGSLPEPAGSLGDTAPAGDGEECDVVIVGSGAGGAVAAATLAEAGLDVIVLEAGDHYNRDSYPSDPLEAIASLYRDGGLTIAEGRPPIPVPVGAGGRRHDRDQLRHLLPRPRPGPRRLAPALRRRVGARPRPRLRRGRGVPARHPARPGADGAQRPARDGGRAGDRGERRPDLPQRRQLRAVQLLPLRLRDRRQARHARQLPAARGGRRGANPRRGRRRTESWSKTAARSACAAPPATAAGNGRRRPYTVRARRATIVAGGALGTPELLLRSGLGGRQVGRNLHIHPACWVGARYEEEVRGWEGVMQSYYVDEWERERVLLEATFTPLPFGGAWLLGAGREHQEAMLRFDRIGSIGVHLSDESAGRVGVARDGSLRTSYRLSGEDARRLVFGIARAAEIHFAAGATEVYPNIGRVPVLRPDRLAEFEATAFAPSELRLEAFHPMGTARIAADPREGVCAADGSVNGADGLYVADASLFPTSVGVNPMMTAIAFAKKIAAGIAETPAA